MATLSCAPHCTARRSILHPPVEKQPQDKRQQVDMGREKFVSGLSLSLRSHRRWPPQSSRASARMRRDDRLFAQVFTDSIASRDRSIALSKDSPSRVPSNSTETAASRAANPRWKSMNQFGCGSGSGTGISHHHGGSFGHFGLVGHQSSSSSNAGPGSTSKRSACQAVLTNS